MKSRYSWPRTMLLFGKLSKQVIEKEDGFTVIAEAGDGREAVRLARKLMRTW